MFLISQTLSPRSFWRKILIPCLDFLNLFASVGPLLVRYSRKRRHIQKGEFAYYKFLIIRIVLDPYRKFLKMLEILFRIRIIGTIGYQLQLLAKAPLCGFWISSCITIRQQYCSYVVFGISCNSWQMALHLMNIFGQFVKIK